MTVEVQKHGFTWEKQLLRLVYGATENELKKISYTSKLDLPPELNRLDGCGVSIKTSGKKNEVCMGDVLRVYDAVGDNANPIHLTVVHYNQDVTTKNITTIIELDLTNSRNELFGNINRYQLEELANFVQSVPQKRKPTEDEYKKMYSIRDSLQPQSGAIHLDIKCDNTNSRVQCKFNRFQQFIKNVEKRIVAKSNINEFRGGAISPHLISSRRVIKKKPVITRPGSPDHKRVRYKPITYYFTGVPTA